MMILLTFVVANLLNGLSQEPGSVAEFYQERSFTIEGNYSDTPSFVGGI